VAPLAVQVATGTFVVTTGAGQVVAFQLVPALAAMGVQVATGTSVVMTEPQLVVVQLLPALAATGAHEGTPFGPTTTGAGQVVVV
jgi:hypothetical protein